MNSETKPSARVIPNPTEELSRQYPLEHFNGAASSRPTLTIQNILVPTDFSDHSTVALSYAIRFAGQLGARITLLHVIKPALATPEAGVWCPDIESEYQIADAAERTAARICEREKLSHSILKQTLVWTGAPSETITETARDQNSDLIIIATHGRTGLAHALLGSCAEKIIRQAPCPVLVVRVTESDPWKDDRGTEDSPGGQ
jgi:nucleotide-binding universal stress UspA family protein